MTPFELAEPRSLGEAIRLLDRDDPAIRPIAGGTALMLMMKIGLFRPVRLVSLQAIEDRYAGIAASPDGALRIGAMATLRAIERSADLRRLAPVIARALKTLANVRVRNVATLGGHLAHADPHLDLPPVLTALDARLVIAGPEGERTMPVSSLFAGYLETVLKYNELIAEIVVPPQVDWRAVYVKCTARSADDWPSLGLAVALKTDGRTIAEARLVAGAAVERPTALAGAAALLRGAAPSDDLLRRVGEAAAAEAPVIGDQHGSAAYKRQLLRVHVARAVRAALAEPAGAAS
jgi:aerobic carbon-monoxide dehydrogenase medium subunit